MQLGMREEAFPQLLTITLQVWLLLIFPFSGNKVVCFANDGGRNRLTEQLLAFHPVTFVCFSDGKGNEKMMVALRICREINLDKDSRALFSSLTL